MSSANDTDRFTAPCCVPPEAGGTSVVDDELSGMLLSSSPDVAYKEGVDSSPTTCDARKRGTGAKLANLLALCEGTARLRKRNGWGRHRRRSPKPRAHGLNF